MQQPLVCNQQLQPSFYLEGDLEGHSVQCQILGENKGSSRKGGALRDLIYNVSFFHRGGNYIYPDNNDKMYKAGSGARETENGECFCTFPEL